MRFKGIDNGDGWQTVWDTVRDEQVMFCGFPIVYPIEEEITDGKVYRVMSFKQRQGPERAPKEAK